MENKLDLPNLPLNDDELKIRLRFIFNQIQILRSFFEQNLLSANNHAPNADSKYIFYLIPCPTGYATSTSCSHNFEKLTNVGTTRLSGVRTSSKWIQQMETLHRYNAWNHYA